MPNGKIFAAEFTLRRNVSALDKLLIEDSEDGVVKYAYPPQVSALSGYAYAESIADLPDNPANKTIAYVVGRMLYIYVGEGGDAKNGEYQSVDFLVGPQGIPGEKGDKGDPGDGSIDEAYLANYLQQNQYQTAADVNSKLALYATKQYVQDEISELLGGASSAFDTLKEIEDVLAGNVDSIGDLFAVLDTKWTQDNTLIAHWNEAYSWGNHALAGYLTQADASDFITVTEAQTITGAKNFTGGLQVNGSAIVYNSALGVWQLTGDLLVTGGISMYSSIEGFVPSTITDAVLIDNQTIKRNSLGALYAVAAGLDESQLAAYLTTNNYAKKSDITTALVPYALASAIPTNNNQLTNGAGYITASALNGYAKLTDIPSLAGYATETFVNTAVNGVKEWVEEQQYLTEITSGMIESVLGYQPYDGDTNRLGFLTSSALNGYATQSWVNTALAGYLPLSGGTLTDALTVKGSGSPLTVHRTQSLASVVKFVNTDGNLGWLGVDVDKTAIFIEASGVIKKLLHSGNYSYYALPKDGTAASATKLATSRTIWGQSFDGTGNVSGTFNNILNAYRGSSAVAYLHITNVSAAVDYVSMYVSNLDNSRTDRPLVLQNGYGNVAIGGTTANAKLHVYGNLLTEGGITMYSQRSLKNILSYDGLSLEQLSVIKPIKFTWKDGRDNRYHVGGVADDVATVVPEVVYSTNDFLTMDYGNAGFYVAASLIKPVIDHEQRIKILEQENKALRDEINQLKQAS